MAGEVAEEVVREQEVAPQGKPVERNSPVVPWALPSVVERGRGCSFACHMLRLAHPTADG